VAAADRAATLFVRSRNDSRAKAFAAWATGIGVPTTVARGGPVEVDVVINATPLGLAGHDPLPIDLNHIPGVQTALDLVYAPGETRWVHALRERGIEAMDGREVLVQQGAAAFERFFPGTTAPREVMRAAVQRALRV
jgi:shikimate dehydrogenase